MGQYRLAIQEECLDYLAKIDKSVIGKSLLWSAESKVKCAIEQQVDHNNLILECYVVCAARNLGWEVALISAATWKAYHCIPHFGDNRSNKKESVERVKASFLEYEVKMFASSLGGCFSGEGKRSRIHDICESKLIAEAAEGLNLFN